VKVAVLGSMHVDVYKPALGGVDYQVRGRAVAADGRKHITEVAMLDPNGETVAEALTVWISLD
jgi:hypothetical protein